MGDPPRQPSKSRFATTVIEQNAGPVRDGGVLVAPPVARKPTPTAMPAPPPSPVVRESHDNLEHVLELGRAERERAILLTQLQDSEDARKKAVRELEQLRAPVAPFPPLSVPPPAPMIPSPVPSLMETKIEGDIERLQKKITGSVWGKRAATIGILFAIAGNAFNAVRAKVPEQKVDAVKARLQQNEQLSGKELENQVLERQRNLQRMRALQCWAKQLRGAVARQGLDLQSLPPGGVTAFKLGDEDPNRPGPPRFVVLEKCPDFPQLPPDMAGP